MVLSGWCFLPLSRWHSFTPISQFLRLSHKLTDESSYIRHILPSSINWYPGHMQKGLKDIDSRLAEVDVIIEIHDARIPLTGRCRFIKEAGQIRPHILVMSKVDLCEPIKDRDAHKRLIREDPNSGLLYQPPTEIIFANLKSPERMKHTLHRILSSIANLAPRWEGFNTFSASEFREGSASQSQRTINAMVVGLPNCGKSSLINALRCFAPAGQEFGGVRRRSAVGVGRDAGRTRSVGTPVVIARDFPVTDAVTGATCDLCTVRLIDTPGILEPRATSLCGQLSLAVCGSVDWGAVDKLILVDYLLFCLNARQQHDYVRVFGLPGPTARVDEVLAWVAARRRLLRPSPRRHRHRDCQQEEEGFEGSSGSGLEPDLDAAATHLLRAFNEGALGRITFLPSVDEARAAPFFILSPSAFPHSSAKKR